MVSWILIIAAAIILAVFVLANIRALGLLFLIGLGLAVLVVVWMLLQGAPPLQCGPGSHQEGWSGCRPN